MNKEQSFDLGLVVGVMLVLVPLIIFTWPLACLIVLEILCRLTTGKSGLW